HPCSDQLCPPLPQHALQPAPRARHLETSMSPAAPPGGCPPAAPPQRFNVAKETFRVTSRRTLRITCMNTLNRTETYERSKQRNHDYNVSASHSLDRTSRNLGNGDMARTHRNATKESKRKRLKRGIRRRDLGSVGDPPFSAGREAAPEAGLETCAEAGHRSRSLEASGATAHNLSLSFANSCQRWIWPARCEITAAYCRF